MTLHTGRFNALAFAALLLMLVSCEGHEPSHALADKGKGKVMLSLSTDLSIDIKSEASPISDFDDYRIRFVGVDGYATSDYYRYGDVPNPMTWYFGIFRLQAESCTAEQAETGRGCLRYEGISQPFAVINDQTATASVICTVANVLVKVNFDDSMYLAFDDYKLTVTSVTAPPAEDDSEDNDEETENFVPEVYRILDFTPFDLSGYFNLQDEPVNLKYELWVKMQGAEIMIPAAEGYFSLSEQGTPSVPAGGDIITFNVAYTGEVDVTDGIKFIVKGVKTTLNNSLDLDDYVDGEVKEDQ